jgi:hypothetical protein
MCLHLQFSLNKCYFTLKILVERFNGDFFIIFAISLHLPVAQFTKLSKTKNEEKSISIHSYIYFPT